LETSNYNSGLSTGSIVGIVVGVCVPFLLLLIIIPIVYFKLKKNKAANPPSKEDNEKP